MLGYSGVRAQELEEDPELRAKVALFRDPAIDPAAGAARRAAAMTDTDDDDEDVPEVRPPARDACTCLCASGDRWRAVDILLSSHCAAAEGLRMSGCADSIMMLLLSRCAQQHQTTGSVECGKCQDSFSAASVLSEWRSTAREARAAAAHAQVPLEELLDDLAGLQLDEGEEAAGEAGHAEDGAAMAE
jgi:hypothetical protein